MTPLRPRARLGLGGCLAALTGLGLYLSLSEPVQHELGLSDARFESLPIGASREQVRQILGEPEHRYTRAAEGAEVVHCVRPCMGGGYEPQWADFDRRFAAMRPHITEVWKWSKGLRLICMVFDERGKVIFKYVDA